MLFLFKNKQLAVRHKNNKYKSLCKIHYPYKHNSLRDKKHLKIVERDVLTYPKQKYNHTLNSSTVKIREDMAVPKPRPPRKTVSASCPEAVCRVLSKFRMVTDFFSEVHTGR